MATSPDDSKTGSTASDAYVLARFDEHNKNVEIEMLRGVQKRYLQYYLVQNTSAEQALRVSNLSASTVDSWREKDPEFKRLSDLHATLSTAERMDALNDSPNNYKNVIMRAAVSHKEADELTSRVYGAMVASAPATPSLEAAAPAAPNDAPTSHSTNDKPVPAVVLSDKQKHIAVAPDKQAHSSANHDKNASATAEPSAGKTDASPSPLSVLREKYASLGLNRQSRALKQAIFWTVYESDGKQKMGKTNELLGISAATMYASISNLSGDVQDQLKTSEGRKTWRELPVYKEAIATIDKWLGRAGKEGKSSADTSQTGQTSPSMNIAAPVESVVVEAPPKQLAEGEKTDTSAAISPATKADSEPAPVSADFKTSVSSAEADTKSRIIAATQEEIAATWAQQELLGRKTEEEWTNALRRRDDSRREKTNLLNRF